MVGQIRNCTYFTGHFVWLNTTEVEHIIKVHGRELCLLQHLLAEFALSFHDTSEHLIIRTAREEDLAGVELV